MVKKYKKSKIVLGLLVPNLLIGGIVSHECKRYACFLEFEKKYGITDYNAVEVKPGVWAFEYDTKETKQYKQKAKEKNVLSLYEKSLIAYKNKQYQKSYDGFNTLFEKDLNNPNVNYYLGLSAYQIGKYEDAILAYERVLFEKPEASKVRFELARTNLKLENYGEAKKQLDTLSLNPNLPIAIQKIIAQYYALIDSKTKKHFFNGVVLAGLNYDDNINSDPDGLLLTSELKTKEIAKWAHQEVLLVNHKYKMDEQSIFKNDIMIFNKGMFDREYSANDVQLFAYTPAYAKTYNDKLNVDYAFFIDYLRVNSKASMSSFGIFPKVTYTLNKEYQLNGSFKYQDKNYIQSADKERNSKFYQIDGGVKYVHNPKMRYGFKGTYSTEKKEKNVRTDIDKKNIGFDVDLEYKHSNKFLLTPKIGYKKVFYLDTDPVENRKRQDTQMKFSLTNTYVYSPKWIVQGIVEHLDNHSKFDQNKYDKNTLSVNVVRPF